MEGRVGSSAPRDSSVPLTAPSGRERRREEPPGRARPDPAAVHAPFSASSRRAGHGRRCCCAGGDPHGLLAASNGTPRLASPPGQAPPGPARPPPCGAGLEPRRPRPGEAEPEPGGLCGAAPEGAASGLRLLPTRAGAEGFQRPSANAWTAPPQEFVSLRLLVLI